MHSWGDQFGKRTAWLLSYFLIYVYLNILAQSQILRNSLYVGILICEKIENSKPKTTFLLEWFIRSDLTLWKGFKNVANEGHSLYCEWPSTHLQHSRNLFTVLTHSNFYQ